MSESPPPAYSQLEDDPFVDNPPVLVPTQPSGPQSLSIDYRALHGYGPEIPAPESFIQPPDPPVDGKWYIVTASTEILITGTWGIAATRAVGVPGSIYKAQPTWRKAVEYYTVCYRDGSIKILQPRDSLSTPGHSASTAVTIHSTAPTPTQGDRAYPIHISSSPISASVTSTPQSGNHNTDLATYTPVAGNRTLPILITSSPIAAPAVTEKQGQRSPNTIKRHKYVERLFAKMSESKDLEKSAGPSQLAAWRDTTPVSIPHTMVLSQSVKSPAADDHNPILHSTPRKTGKAKVIVIEDDSDDEYFPDEDPFTAEQLEALHEWEETYELQQALSSPRFD